MDSLMRSENREENNYSQTIYPSISSSYCRDRVQEGENFKTEAAWLFLI